MSTNDAPDTPAGNKAHYDDQEARSLLSDVTGGWEVHDEARKAAAQALLEQFETLAKEYGVTVRVATSRFRGTDFALLVYPRPHEHGVILSRLGDTISLSSEAAPQQQRRLPLRFNPGDKRLEGEAFDQELVPVPGTRLRRRSALAVLASAVFPAVAT